MPVDQQHLASSAVSGGGMAPGSDEPKSDPSANDGNVDGMKAEPAVSVRANTLGQRAAVRALVEDPDALWVNGAHGPRAIDRSNTTAVEKLFERTRKYRPSGNNGDQPNGASGQR